MSTFLQKTKNYIMNNPWKVIGIAFVTSFLGSFLVDFFLPDYLNQYYTVVFYALIILGASYVIKRVVANR